MSALMSMTEVVNFDQTPSRFLGDLIHDGVWVAKNPDTDFYWVIRDSGTQICKDRESLDMVTDTFEDVAGVYFYNHEKDTMESLEEENK